MRLRQLEVGQEFEFAGYEWLVLEHDAEECQTLVIAKECIGDMTFDKNFSNDFRNSTLRKFLNSDFLEKLIDRGLKPGDIAYTDFDLTKHKGETDYGVCRDIVGLLTEEQYKKYRNILILDNWWWLITPHSRHPHYVRHVISDGSLGYNYMPCSIGVRPTLSLKSHTEVIVDKYIELDKYSSVELLQELLRREYAGYSVAEPMDMEYIREAIKDDEEERFQDFKKEIKKLLEKN